MWYFLIILTFIFIEMNLMVYSFQGNTKVYAKYMLKLFSNRFYPRFVLNLSKNLNRLSVLTLCLTWNTQYGTCMLEFIKHSFKQVRHIGAGFQIKTRLISQVSKLKRKLHTKVRVVMKDTPTLALKTFKGGGYVFRCSASCLRLKLSLCKSKSLF